MTDPDQLNARFDALLGAMVANPKNDKPRAKGAGDKKVEKDDGSRGTKVSK